MVGVRREVGGGGGEGICTSARVRQSGKRVSVAVESQEVQMSRGGEQQREAEPIAAVEVERLGSDGASVVHQWGDVALHVRCEYADALAGQNRPELSLGRSYLRLPYDIQRGFLFAQLKRMLRICRQS